MYHFGTGIATSGCLAVFYKPMSQGKVLVSKRKKPQGFTAKGLFFCIIVRTSIGAKKLGLNNQEINCFN